MATGTRTGALDDSFSVETKLELWDLALGEPSSGPGDQLPQSGMIATDAGFNDIAWSEPSEEYPLGVIAGALENGAVDLWDAAKLRDDGGNDARISRTTTHSGAVKALQWNPYRHTLLASVGAKGEIFIYDLSNMANPYRLGATAARADDIECLDWNKQEKTAHILATGSSGGFVTVWDVKQKKDILTLNNQGRKAISAVAWDPEESTKLATATPTDQDAAVLLWSLRNSSAPEKTLKGHELGVLGLAWCLQDPELLLSCGKDNRTICWNSRTGEKYGDFAAGSNWAFQTRWNPHNPSLIASASFDGQILVTSIQSTNSKPEDQAQANQALDDQDFFAKAQSQPRGISFTLPKAPKWAARPSSVSFGYGGKIVRVGRDSSRKSIITIDTFSVEDAVSESAERFEEKMKTGDVASILNNKIEDSKTEEDKADWKVIETLNAGKSRKRLREYLGFEDELVDKPTSGEKPELNGEGTTSTDNKEQDDDFFGRASNDDSFLADLAATKGARTNNPFSIYTGSESEADRSITHALLLGNFESALDTCLGEDRMSDAFMIAVCGGQKFIDKAQSAFLRKQGKDGKSYLRILASISGKNLWDMVHNADLSNWKELMATLCTYADETEFVDLCEALGDRLEQSFQADGQRSTRRDASFCYLAGAKLEKVVANWVQELQEQEKAALAEAEEGNDFSIHAKCLQNFVEKVSVFRKVVDFRDTHEKHDEEWKLAPLYSLYTEYADMLAAHGQLDTAEQYLSLLPAQFGGAESAQRRVRQANRKIVPANQRQPVAVQPSNARMPPAGAHLSTAQPLAQQPRNMTPGPYAPARSSTPGQAPYAPTSTSSGPYAPTANSYAPAGYQPPQTQTQSYGGYQAPQQSQAPLPPPPRASTASPAVVPASQTKSSSNWNDMPEGFFKDRQPNSRRGTPAPQPISSPFPNAAPQNLPSHLPPTGPSQYGQTSISTLPPPPKAGEGPPRVTSPPALSPAVASQARPQSASKYAPAQPTGGAVSPVGSSLRMPSSGPPIPRGNSPYQPPPSTSSAAPSNRYAPAAGSQPSPGFAGPPGQRQVAPNPYMMQQQQGQYGGQPHPQQSAYGQPPRAHPTPPPPRANMGPPPQGPPQAQQAALQVGPPPSGPPRNSTAGVNKASLPQTAADARAETSVQAQSAPPQPKYPRGDRSHISAHAQPIVDLLTPEIHRIKSVAPAQFKPQVDDMEKRINILFDHLNNQDLLSSDTVEQMVHISRAVEGKEWERAMGIFTEMQTAKLEREGTHWMVRSSGVGRLLCHADAFCRLESNV